ncbi:MAG: hypothetical protein L3J63_11585, partial [Geopsychrobacter sp.]|nr:hypothetical protein [Geopsychrobacter sp.]
MNPLNADAVAREQETMMQRGFGMLSGKFSVLIRLAVLAAMGAVFVGTVTTVHAGTTCTEVTPSSLVFNGVVAAAGDFSGLTMVTPVDLASLQFRITEDGAPFNQSDNFDANNFGNWTPWDDNASNNWLLDNNGTPSSNVGPSADHSGSGYYVYTESSSGSENDVYTLTSNS